MNNSNAVPVQRSDNVVPMAVAVGSLALSIDDAARELSVSQKTIRRLIDRGEIVAFKPGWQWRIHRTDFEAFILARKNAQRRAIGK